MIRLPLTVFLEKAGQVLAALATFVIVARLIGPEEFGLAGLVAVFPIFATLVVLGSLDAVISQRLTEDRPLSTLFWAVMAIGLGIGLITFFGAGWYSHIMGEPRLEGLLRTLAVLPLLIAATSIPSTLLQARMQFRIFTIRSLVASILSGILRVVLAFKGYGAYALVFQQIAREVINNLNFWLSVKWLPRLVFDRKLLRGLLAPRVNNWMMLQSASF